MEREKPKRTVTLGGREFYVPRRTILEHDLYLSAIFIKARVLDLTPAADETDSEYEDRLFQTLLDSGQGHRAIPMLPVEIDYKDWTPEVSAENDRHFRALDDPMEKEICELLIRGSLANFLKSGRVSSNAFRRSSISRGTGMEAALERYRMKESGASGPGPSA